MKDDSRRTLFIAVVVGFVLTVIIVVGFYISSLLEQNEGRISIKNYSQYVKNLPKTEQEYLEKALYDTVSLNVSDKEKIKSIKDAAIRSDSYSQKVDDDLYTTVFIVDIESIKQSYELQNVYSRLDTDASSLHDYTHLALCLPKEKLKFGEFKCKDRISVEKGVEQANPILQYLPYSTLDYTLRQDTSSSELKLIAELILNEADYRTGVEDSINNYKESLRNWFASKNLNIDDYSITYSY